MDHLTRAWLFLILLSLASTLVALLLPGLRGWPVQGAAVLILIIAMFKARIILAQYLELDTAPRWRRGFFAAITTFTLAAGALYLAG